MTDPVYEYMMSLSGAQFEQEIAKYLATHGFTNVRVFGGAGDRGVDIKCTDNDGMEIAVQCKRYTKSVGSPAIQSFSGVQLIHGCQRAIFVTTSTFTEPAIRIAHQFDIELVSGANLRQYFTQVLAWQEAARRETERQEAARLEAERREAEWREVARRRAEQQEAERQEMARQEVARREDECQEAARREAEWREVRSNREITERAPAAATSSEPCNPMPFRRAGNADRIMGDSLWVSLAKSAVIPIVSIAPFVLAVFFGIHQDQEADLDSRSGPLAETPTVFPSLGSDQPQTVTVVQSNGASLLAQPSAGARTLAIVGAGTRLTVNGSLMNVVDDKGRRQWWWPVLVPNTVQVGYLAISPDQETTSEVLASLPPKLVSTTQADGLTETIRVTLSWDASLKVRPSEGARIVATVDAGSVLTVTGPPMEAARESGIEETWWPVLVPGTDQEAYIAGHSLIATE